MSVFDVVLGLVLLAETKPALRFLGEQPGFSARWGIGQLFGYAMVEAYASVSPTSEALHAVAALRAVAAPADLVAARHARRGIGHLLRAVACFNVAATAIFVTAGRQAQMQRRVRENRR